MLSIEMTLLFCFIFPWKCLYSKIVKFPRTKSHSEFLIFSLLSEQSRNINHCTVAKISLMIKKKLVKIVKAFSASFLVDWHCHGCDGSLPFPLEFTQIPQRPNSFLSILQLRVFISYSLTTSITSTFSKWRPWGVNPTYRYICVLGDSAKNNFTNWETSYNSPLSSYFWNNSKRYRNTKSAGDESQLPL